MNSSEREVLRAGAAAMGLVLDDEVLSRFDRYLSLLQEWGKKVNLTSRLETAAVISHHFLDSLAGAPLIAASSKRRLVDIGAGAGLPSLPLKFALTDLQVLLVESVRKKVAFCQEVLRKTGVAQVEVAWGRAEDVVSDARRLQSFDWAVSRAVGAAADIARIALPFLAPGGRLLLYKGDPSGDELHELELFCAPRRGIVSIERIAVPGLDAQRALVMVAFPEAGE